MTLIAHLSDPHLDASPERLARLRRVLEQVRGLPEVQALVVTGDIADHGAPAEYEEFFTAVRNIVPEELATVVVPGNHDLSDAMSSALLAAEGTSSLNATITLAGTLGQTHGETLGQTAGNGQTRGKTVNDVTVIGLDSHIDRADEGELSSATVQFAQSALQAAPGPVLLALHHPPVPVGHHVMDRFGLRNPQALNDLVRSHEKIVAVLTGHVHTSLATTFAGRPLLGAPGIASTMRLGSRTDPIADPDAVPGFALHTLHGNAIRTVFHYLTPTSA